MKQIVEQIYSMANSNWDGGFDSLDDHVKDSAVRLYLLTDGIDSLEEIFPPCCSGAELLLLNALYDDQHRFRRVFSSLTVGHTPAESFSSEALNPDETKKLIEAYVARDTFEITKIFGDAIYDYCENSLIEGCEDYFDTIQAEWVAALAEDDQLQGMREAV